MTGPAPFAIVQRPEVTTTEVERLETALYAFNQAATGRRDGRDLGFVAVDAEGAELGALAGYTWAGMAEIRQLFVREEARGQGVGRALVDAAVAEAGARGCQVAWVMSYTFQAPGLYERCGFRRFATLDGWPPGHAHVVLRRDL